MDQMPGTNSADMGPAGMTGRSNDAQKKAKAGTPDGAGLDLQQYFPYRLARLAEQVSLAVAEVYLERFSLSRQEWRILAALGEQPRLPTKQIGRLTTLDKMNVSRAMQSLEARGIVSRSRDPEDGRERIVTLTAAGRGLYRRIVPYALARESDLLGVLSAAELATLDTVIDKLLAAAERAVDDPVGRKP